MNIETPKGWTKKYMVHKPTILGQVSYGYIDICKMGKDIELRGNCLKDPHELIKFGIQNDLGIYIGTKAETDDIKWYPTSSTNKKLREDHQKYEWIRVVFDWGSDEEMRQEEPWK